MVWAVGVLVVKIEVELSGWSWCYVGGHGVIWVVMVLSGWDGVKLRLWRGSHGWLGLERCC